MSSTRTSLQPPEQMCKPQNRQAIISFKSCPNWKVESWGTFGGKMAFSIPYSDRILLNAPWHVGHLLGTFVVGCMLLCCKEGRQGTTFCCI